jgi:hypothetical protein
VEGNQIISEGYLPLKIEMWIKKRKKKELNAMEKHFFVGCENGS